jgi:hypothetical protein
MEREMMDSGDRALFSRGSTYTAERLIRSTPSSAAVCDLPLRTERTDPCDSRTQSGIIVDNAEILAELMPTVDCGTALC